MYQDIPATEIGSKNEFYNISYKNFKDMCDIMLDFETKMDPLLKTTTKKYILFNYEKPIGEVGIRTTLSDFWINKGSQIYYKIRKSERNKGYGNIILALALKEASKLKFTQIRINCDDNNIASKKIILKNGGKIDIEHYKTKDGTSSSYIITLDENL